MTSGGRRAAVAVATVFAVATVGCTSAEDRFCGQLRDDYQLEELVTAIRQRDQRRTTEGLERLRQLQDVAPAEIHDDFRAVVDAVSSAVRAVTNATGADGESVPVDLTVLGDELAAIDEPAHNVATYADRECGLELDP